jgi:hypothetical protein
MEQKAATAEHSKEREEAKKDDVNPWIANRMI